jgi:hypothetical protein
MLEAKTDSDNATPHSANSDSQADEAGNKLTQFSGAAEEGQVNGSDADPSLESGDTASSEDCWCDETSASLSSEERTDPSVPSRDASREIVVRESDEQQGAPDDLLLMIQLHEAISRSSLDSDAARERMAADTEDLYRGLDPKSARDSILCRTIVAANDATMKCFGRAAQTNESFALQLNLRFAFKGAQTIAQLMEVYDKLRAVKTPSLSIGPVSVEAGAQAIVGEVTISDRRQLTNGHKQLPHPEEDSNE